jgi:PAS domain S-box-containing protein
MHPVGNTRVAWLRRFQPLLRDRSEIRLAALAGALIVGVGVMLGLGQHEGVELFALARPATFLGIALGLGVAYAAAGAVAAHRRELRLSEALRRWQLIFEHAGWGVAIGSSDGVTLAQMNPAYAKMHGYSSEELTGQAIEVVFPVESRPDLAAALALTRKLGRHHFESLHRHRDGRVFPVAIEMSLVRDAGDAIVYHIVNVQDVGELRDARREAQIAKEFFQSTFAATPVGMVVTDADGRYVRVNRAMCEFTGYSESELLGMKYGDITHPDDQAQKTWGVTGAAESRFQSFQAEKRYRHKSGREIWALLTMLRASDGDGKLLYWAGQVLDIDSLKRTELALRISEERFRGVFENANTGIAVANRSGRIAYFNEALRSMLGHEAHVLEAMHFADLSFPEDRSFPGDVARETTLLDEILRKNSDRYRIEKRWIAGDGRTLWVDLHISAVRDEAGEVVNFIAVVADISERKKSALALRDSKQKLRALAAHQEGMLEIERKHIAGEVHDEMGQLLTALKMDISLMRLRFGENLQLLGMIDEMRSLVERTINVVRQVASNLRPAVLDHGLAPAIEWLAADFAKRGTMRCRFDAGSGGYELPELQATAVFRVVQESLTNVTRHSQAREVVITMQRCGQLLQVVVRDDGQGFDTVAVGQSRGFGLFGMRERVLALGGSLRIVSAPKLGTSVTIKLPLMGEHP